MILGQVLGLGQQQTLQIGDDSGDDVILIKSPKRDSITISDDEMPLATSSPRREFGSGGGVEEGDEGDEGEEGSEVRGWGECPVCSQVSVDSLPHYNYNGLLVIITL